MPPTPLSQSWTRGQVHRTHSRLGQALLVLFFFFTLTLDSSSRVASFPAQRTLNRPGDLALIHQPSFPLTLISPACLGFKSLPLVFFFLLLAQHAACLQNSEETLLDENHTGKKSISFPDSPKLSTVRDHLLPPGILGQTPNLPPIEGSSGLSSEELTVGSLCKYHTQHLEFKTCGRGENEGRSSSPSLPLFFLIIFFLLSRSFLRLPLGRGEGCV